jgi:Spy/CpxP family protein refolding chaperone
MSSTLKRWWAAVGVLLALAAPVHAQSFGFSWWKDAQFQRDLGLTADQTAKIDAIFQSTISLLRQKKADLDRQEDDLSRMIAAGADESLVTRQVDKVESTRASMNKMRTLMLLHERQVLTPDQRVRLNKLHEQMFKDKDRGKSRENRR